jgi:MscS family membrane protein
LEQIFGVLLELKGNLWIELAAILTLALIGYAILKGLLTRAKRGAQRTQLRWDDVLFRALSVPSRVAYWALVALLIWAWLPKGFTMDYQVYLASVPRVLLILGVAWVLHRLIAGFECEYISSQAQQLDSTGVATVHAIAKLTRVALWIIVVLTVLQALGVSVSGLLAFGGIGGIAVGFAAKDLLANFFGGMSIYLDRPFAPGDWIRSPDREIEGTVEDIGWRLTRIRTFDQRPLYIPNSVFSQIAVENPSRMHNRRIYETIGVRYQDSHVLRALVADVRNMLATHPDIDTNRTLIVNFNHFGASSLDFFIYTFTRTTDWVTYHRVKEDVLLKVLDLVHQHGADVAFPTRTVHLETHHAPEI